MDRKPFEPLDGVTPRWKKLFDLVMNREVGDEVTYREAAEVLGFDRLTDRSLKITQESMRDAQRHLENQGERTVGTIVRFGWVILDAQRELQQVDRRLIKTRRAASRTLRGARALGTRREELSQFERERLDRISLSAQMAGQIAGRRSMRLEELKKMVEGGSAQAG